jgi:hypothetical protein
MANVDTPLRTMQENPGETTSLAGNPMHLWLDLGKLSLPRSKNIFSDRFMRGVGDDKMENIALNSPCRLPGRLHFPSTAQPLQGKIRRQAVGSTANCFS